MLATGVPDSPAQEAVQGTPGALKEKEEAISSDVSTAPSSAKTEAVVEVSSMSLLERIAEVDDDGSREALVVLHDLCAVEGVDPVLEKFLNVASNICEHREKCKAITFRRWRKALKG